MKLESCRRGNDLYLYFDGELDEYTVSQVRAAADRLIDEHAGISRAIFNLSQMRFMDSTGIGFLIGRYKKLHKNGVNMYLDSPNLSADKVLTLSGVYTLIPKL
jgi:stage II sporulation protein AA (anti-sigma F factor antagonist)